MSNVLFKNSKSVVQNVAEDLVMPVFIVMMNVSVPCSTALPMGEYHTYIHISPDSQRTYLLCRA